jgi:DNA-binding NarL/FixJ family response regulator
MGEQARTRVFVAEDSAEVRRHVVDLVEEVAGAYVVGEAESVEAVVTGIMRTEPDCVVLDFRLVGGTGLDVLHAVHPRAPHIAFIVLTNFATPQYKRACIAAGASCFFDKSTEFARIRDAIAGLEPMTQ